MGGGGGRGGRGGQSNAQRERRSVQHVTPGGFFTDCCAGKKTKRENNMNSVKNCRNFGFFLGGGGFYLNLNNKNV